jgi:hypothetical protein
VLFSLLNIVMSKFQPDLDYVVDQIADAYACVLLAVEANELERAWFWQCELEKLTAGLDRWVTQSK